MKCKSLFSRKKNINLSSAEFFQKGGAQKIVDRRTKEEKQSI